RAIRQKHCASSALRSGLLRGLLPGPPSGGRPGAGPGARDLSAPLMSTPLIDLDHLLKLRLIVARFGEMDLAKWWNTRGQLGRLGTAALRRGFPRTHRFA